jgi:hypothetical protein
MPRCLVKSTGLGPKGIFSERAMIGQLNNSATISGGTVQNAWNAGQWAEFYASEFGWRVFPCYWIKANGKCSCGEDCGKDAGKHPITAAPKQKSKSAPKPARWDATTDLVKIRGWFKRWPNANIGIAMGNGVAGIDIDPRHGGDANLTRCVAELGALPSGHVANTGGGGQHILASVPAGVKIPNLNSKLGKGIDIKGDGGYIIAAPSNHHTGGRYTWQKLTMSAPAPMPAAWLKEILKHKSGGQEQQGNGTDSIPICSSLRRDMCIKDTICPKGVIDPFRKSGGLTPAAASADLLSLLNSVGLTDTEKRILAALKRSRIVGTKQTNDTRCALTTSLKNIPALHDAPFEKVLPFFWHWYDAGKEYMSEQEWEKVKSECQYQWDEWGQSQFGPHWNAARTVASSGMTIVGVTPDERRLVALKAVCTVMQQAIDNGIWHLSCRAAGDVLKSLGFKAERMTGNRLLCQLVEEGFLIKAINRKTGSPWAQRYQTAEAARRCVEHDQQQQPQHLPPAIASRLSTPTDVIEPRNRLTTAQSPSWADTLITAGRDEPLSTDFASVRPKQLYAVQCN